MFSSNSSILLAKFNNNNESASVFLCRYNLGVDPKEEAEEKSLVSPFMKLEMDEPKKVHVELDLDEGNLSKGIDNCWGMVKVRTF